MIYLLVCMLITTCVISLPDEELRLNWTNVVNAVLTPEWKETVGFESYKIFPAVLAEAIFVNEDYRFANEFADIEAPVVLDDVYKQNIKVQDSEEFFKYSQDVLRQCIDFDSIALRESIDEHPKCQLSRVESELIIGTTIFEHAKNPMRYNSDILTKLKRDITNIALNICLNFIVKACNLNTLARQTIFFADMKNSQYITNPRSYLPMLHQYNKSFKEHMGEYAKRIPGLMNLKQMVTIAGLADEFEAKFLTRPTITLQAQTEIRQWILEKIEHTVTERSLLMGRLSKDLQTKTIIEDIQSFFVLANWPMIFNFAFIEMPFHKIPETFEQSMRVYFYNHYMTQMRQVVRLNYDIFQIPEKAAKLKDIGFLRYLSQDFLYHYTIQIAICYNAQKAKALMLKAVTGRIFEVHELMMLLDYVQEVLKKQKVTNVKAFELAIATEARDYYDEKVKLMKVKMKEYVENLESISVLKNARTKETIIDFLEEIGSLMDWYLKTRQKELNTRTLATFLPETLFEQTIEFSMQFSDFAISNLQSVQSYLSQSWLCPTDPKANEVLRKILREREFTTEVQRQTIPRINKYEGLDLFMQAKYPNAKDLEPRFEFSSFVLKELGSAILGIPEYRLTKYLRFYGQSRNLFGTDLLDFEENKKAFKVLYELTLTAIEWGDGTGQVKSPANDFDS
jgi:hypothetical protein